MIRYREFQGSNELKKNSLVASVCTGLSLMVVSACGKDAAEKVVDAVTAKVSCNYASLGYCAEYLVDNYAGSDQQTCEAAKGVYAASACTDTGKVKGCELTVNGLKVTRTWAYSDAGVIAVDTACNAYINQNSPNTSAQFITP